MDKSRLYRRAYSLLDSSTPLRMDCGELCGKACCKGDEDLGMHLFPGEESLYAGLPAFLSIKHTNISYTPSRNVLLAVCGGNCERTFRPLACRIFPMVPYIDSNNILSIIIDPRAQQLCPIAQVSEYRKPDPFFRRNVRNAFRLLLQDKEIEEYIKWLSAYIDDYNSVSNMLQL